MNVCILPFTGYLPWFISTSGSNLSLLTIKSNISSITLNTRDFSPHNIELSFESSYICHTYIFLFLHSVSFVRTSTLAVTVLLNRKKLFKSGLVILKTWLLHSKPSPAADPGQFERQKVLKWLVRASCIFLSAQPINNQLLWKYWIRLSLENCT